MPHIHPTAVIDSGAELGQEVRVGPFCIVERGVIVGDRCQLAGHAVLRTGVVLQSDNVIGEGAVFGGPPQHLHAGARYGGLRIGRGNTIREHATIHCALKEGDDTVIGDHNLMMVNAHVAHDCHVGNHTILVNNVMLAGHVLVQDRAYLSGGVAVHQFCRIGKYAMVGGNGRITQDVPPYVLVAGVSAHVVGLNLIGLRRNGFTPSQTRQLKEAFRVIYRQGLTWNEMLDALATQFANGPAAAFREFFESGQRGILRVLPSPRAAELSLVSDEPENTSSAAHHVGRAA